MIKVFPSGRLIDVFSKIGLPISYSPDAGFIGYKPMELKIYQADICPQSSFPLNPFGVVLYWVSKI